MKNRENTQKKNLKTLEYIPDEEEKTELAQMNKPVNHNTQKQKKSPYEILAEELTSAADSLNEQLNTLVEQPYDERTLSDSFSMLLLVHLRDAFRKTAERLDNE
jgi:hypothetical protein